MKNQRLASCDRYVYPDKKIGNILNDDLQDVIQGRKQLQFAYAKSKERAIKCNSCKYLGACNGDCPKHRFIQQESGNHLSYLCKGLYKYFEYIEPFMNYMGREIFYGRNPAKIMRIKRK